MARQKIFLGAGLTLQVEVMKMMNLSMDDYDFDIMVINSAKKNFIQFTKKGRITDTGGITLSQNLTRDEDGKYIVAFNTTDLGIGPITIKVIAQIPDGYFADRIRPEIEEIETNIEVVKGIL